MQLLLIGVWVLAISWMVVVVHELGHYLAGLLVGVPRREMRIHLGRAPHVALRAGGRWLAPDDIDYVRVFRRRVPGLGSAFVFTAGGVVTETLVLLTAAVALRRASAPELALLVVAVSTILLLAHGVVDVVATRRRGRPCGDVSALWRLAPACSGVLLLVVMVLRVLGVVAG